MAEWPIQFGPLKLTVDRSGSVVYICNSL